MRTKSIPYYFIIIALLTSCSTKDINDFMAGVTGGSSSHSRDADVTNYGENGTIDTRRVSAESFDVVWSKAEVFFKQYQTTDTVVDREKGVLRGKAFGLGEQYADCQSLENVAHRVHSGPVVEDEAELIIRVFKEKGGTVVEVAPEFRLLKAVEKGKYKETEFYECRSRGRFEREALNRIAGKIKTAPSSSKAAQSRFSPRVKKAQAQLHKAGYDPGVVDGLMGRRTRSAIRTFQEDYGLSATGNLDQNTLDALGEATATTETKEKVSFEVPSQPKSAKSSGTSTKRSGTFMVTDVTDLLKEDDLFGSEILLTIPAKTRLNVISHTGEYFKVNHKGRVGYIHEEFVEEK